jgi:hypothetical protein
MLLDDEYIGEDFRRLVEERTTAATKRGAKQFIVDVSISGNAYDHYRRMARELGLPMGSVVAAAVERDFAVARGANRLNSEPVLLQLTEYIRELLSLLKGGEGDPQFAASVASLNDLGQRLRAQTDVERQGR